MSITMITLYCSWCYYYSLFNVINFYFISRCQFDEWKLNILCGAGLDFSGLKPVSHERVFGVVWPAIDSRVLRCLYAMNGGKLQALPTVLNASIAGNIPRKPIVPSTFSIDDHTERLSIIVPNLELIRPWAYFMNSMTPCLLSCVSCLSCSSCSQKVYEERDSSVREQSHSNIVTLNPQIQLLLSLHLCR